MNDNPAWPTLVRLHEHLVKWAGHYVSAEAACRVASMASARLVQEATVLYDCEDGPYGEALSLAVPLVIRAGCKEGVLQFGAIGSNPVIPDDEFLCDIARVYSIVYMGAQMASWSFAEREDVARLVRMTCPVRATGAEQMEALENTGSGWPPLRRAFQVLEFHNCGGDLICETASESWKLHEMAGLEWAKTARRLEAMVR